MAVNLERMQALIRATEEAKDETFTMNGYIAPYGSPGCILGNYAARSDLQDAFSLMHGWLHNRDRSDFLNYTSRAVLEHFGINDREAENLFASHGCGGAYTDKQKALAYLRAFVAARTP